ncbi:NDP-hexose 2,3-dehydratase family protein [Vibrio gigantis]|uniref:DNDP-4-keto-6-deoxy-glucose-2,3-dehydratase n=1 Tax=Vibrio gigantis TaxID=296199 RepID=A0A5M9NKN7_9VIBR|nr:NDP-hexose 2,3-dehydratase family protein [Vibrio gigantis]KAA8671163.1 dNDP-4-keto-6-deoxy-glucose-2,3- dehydratase [Vibrio gigantis]
MTTTSYDNQTLTKLLLRSWSLKDTAFSNLSEHLDWIKTLNKTTNVALSRTSLAQCGDWFYDSNLGEIRNTKGSFFKITGIKETVDDQVVAEQPIILQEEIGYLGFLCKVIDGELYFLVQAKIEPGNINKVQLSPTIQATKSNFQQKHGGRKPRYLECFSNVMDENIIYDQIQSEQSSRFYGKRNRNIVVITTDDIEISDSFKFMTLGQIKELMAVDNLVNMDSRTVISCLPYQGEYVQSSELLHLFSDRHLYNSLCHNNDHELKAVLRRLNDTKMYSESKKVLIPLSEMSSWTIEGSQIVGLEQPFKVSFFEIEIEGREVTRWHQPLFEAIGCATLGLLSTVINEERKFLVKLIPEVGCFDTVELGPTIQKEPNETEDGSNVIEQFFLQLLDEKKGVLHDVLLSEEGGRFYHEQNRNIIIDVNEEEMDTIELPPEYMWVSFNTLNRLLQFNNILNLQLRNLISLLRI